MNPISISVKDASKVLGVGRTSTYALINAGKLKTCKFGRRRLVSVASLHALLNDNEA